MILNYCLACGSDLGADGICTNEACMRRKLQLAQKEAQEAADKAKEAEERCRMSTRASNKTAFLGERAAAVQTLNIPDTWI